MNKKPVISTDIDAILSGSLIRSKHVLFLYTSRVNKYAIQASFYAMCHEDEKLLCITCDKTGQTAWSGISNIGIEIIRPENIGDLKNINGKLRIILDGIYYGHGILEEFLEGNRNSIALCMYDLAALEQERLRELVSGHDRLILSTPDMTVLSAGFLDRLYVADATIERFVKEYLDILVLALVYGKPMCGTELLDTIHRNFNVLLSPGTIYPLLHRLKKDGLLECEYGIKRKVYKPARGSEANIRSILDEHLLANEFLNSFLKSKGLEAK